MPVNYKRVYKILIHLGVWVFYILINNVLLFYTDSPIIVLGRTVFTYPLVAALFYSNAYLVADRFIPRRKYGQLVIGSLLLVAVYIALRFGLYSVLFPFLNIERDYSGYQFMFNHFIFDSLWIASQYLLFSYGYWFAYYQVNLQREKQALIISLAALEKDSMLTKIAFLQAQINPHFLFNTLNNIYSIVEEKDTYAADILLKFGDIMRYSLHETDTNFTSLQQEIDVLNDYIELEQIRYSTSSPVQVTFTTSGNFQGQLIPPLLLITLVENAFKHGPHATIGPSWITIQLTVEDQRLQFTIGNSKPLVPTVKPMKYKVNVHHRVGLANIRRRLDLLYPDCHTLTIVDKPDTYIVTLLL